MKINIPQLTLAKIAQMGRHETVDKRSEHYSPGVQSLLEANFLRNLFGSSTILVELAE